MSPRGSLHARARASRILVVDPHPIVRIAMQHMIAQELGLDLCEALSDVPADLESLVALEPDLITLDTNLRGGSSIELIRSLRELLPDTRILVIATHDEQIYGLRVIEAGAHGYVSKSESAATIIRAIRQVLRGKIAISESIAESLRTPSPARRERVELQELSPRELEVFRLIGRGLKTKSIATTLAIRVKTVETHQAKIKRKLGLSGMHELRRVAAVWAAEH